MQSERGESDRLGVKLRDGTDDLLEMLHEEARYYAGEQHVGSLDDRAWQAELESEA